MNNKKLKLGFYTLKQWRKYKIFLIITVIVAFIYGFIIAANNIDFLSSMAIFLGIYMIFALVYVLATNELIKATVKFNKTANYGEYLTFLNSILCNNLASDNYIEVSVIKANCLLATDKEAAFQLFDSLTKPTKHRFFVNWYLVKLCCHLEKGEFEEANHTLNLMKEDKINKKYLAMADELIKIATTSDEIADIEKKQSITTPILNNNLIHADNLISYYMIRKMPEKAQKYAHFILANTTECTEFIKRAEDVLANIPNNDNQNQ